MKFPLLRLSAFMAAFTGACQVADAFEVAPLGEGEGMRLEVEAFVLLADAAAPIVEGFDGTDASAGEAYQKIVQVAGAGVGVFRSSIPVGKAEFDTSYESAEADAERPLSMSANFCRDEPRGRVWAYGYFDPSYRKDTGRYAGELSMIGSGFTPGSIKLLSVVPDSLDSQKHGRVRVLFAKLTASDAAVAALPAHEADEVSIGVFATEVTMPLADYERLHALGLNGAELSKAVRGLGSAKVTGLFGGETLDNGRVRQRAAWDQEEPAEPNRFDGALFDCDPQSLAEWDRGEEADGLGHPPEAASGVLINWFNWQRILPKQEPVVVQIFRWDENWKNPGVIVEKSSGIGSIDASASLTCVLERQQPHLTAVATVGSEGAKDRRAVLLFLRAYERPL